MDLENVKGVISSDKRDTIYIASDFAQYNASNLNSKFYQNVIINYQDKEIICENFDIEMESNMAIAYNNVIITDPKSIMKAGEVAFDLKTKNIDINPESKKKAWELIKSTNCSNFVIGGASISPKHNNFFLNNGSATSSDIETLIEKVKKEVFLKTGTKLELEIKIIGGK